MPIRYYLFIIISFFVLYAVVFKIAKKKKPLKRAFLTMIAGILVLVVIDIISVFTGVYLPVSPLSLTVSACAGVPGVATMLLLSWVL